MGKLDEAIDDLNANIAFLEAGIFVIDPTYERRAAAGAKANNDNKPPPPPPPPPPQPPE